MFQLQYRLRSAHSSKPWIDACKRAMNSLSGAMEQAENIREDERKKYNLRIIERADTCVWSDDLRERVGSSALDD